MDDVFIAPAVAAVTAERVLSRKTTPLLERALAAIIRPFTAATARRSRLELFFLPCAEIQIVTRAANGPKTGASLLVNGFSGRADVAKLDQIPEAAPPQGTTTLAFPLSRDEALEVARKHLLRLGLGRFARLPAPAEIDLVLRRIVQYPWWVRYATSARGFVRFALLDAVTGRVGDSFLREGFLAALARANVPVWLPPPASRH
jgi:hypothetical protein